MSDTLKKSLAIVGAATGIMLGGLGFTAIASAQADDESPTLESDSTESQDADSTEGETSGDRDGKRGHRGGDCGDKHEAIAELLGLSTDEVKAEIEAGNTLADIAEANGVDPQVLVDQLVADATERVEAKVEEGAISEADAEEKLAAVTERAEDRVNNTGEQEDRRGHKGRRGDRAEMNDDGASTDAEA